MKILFSGATGFIGRRAVTELVRNGHEVVALSRHKQSAQNGVKWVEWDGQEGSLTGSACRGVEAIINLAGEPIAQGRWTSGIKNRLIDSRINTTRSLVQAAARLKLPLRVCLSASAIGYYGDRGDEVLTEDSHSGQDFLARLCVDWEAEAAHFLSPSDSLRVILLRTGLVIGRGGGFLGQVRAPFSLGLGGPLGDGQQWMSWIHIDDFIKVLLEGLANDRLVGAVNVVSPRPVRNVEMTRALAQAYRRRAFLRVPRWSLKLALGELAEVLLASQNVVPEKLIRAGFKFNSVDLASALAAETE